MRLSRRPLPDLDGLDDPRIVAAAARSPLVRGPTFSEHADAAELEFREEHEPYDGLEVGEIFFRRKRVLDYLDYTLARTGIEPAGDVVELGAGSCWLSAALSCFPAVEHVIAVEFSERRLVSFGPVSLALLDAPAEKVERRIADFYRHGLEPASADLVVLDAAFHHASDPGRLAEVVFELTKPGGSALLLREPTLTFLTQSRDHGIEAAHGDFEHEYNRRQYVEFLEGAGFRARSVGVRWFHASGMRRVLYRPPLTWLSGPLRGQYAYVGRKSSSGGSSALPLATSASARTKSSG
ncbi:MAG: class I SAM-dependent methyltransferase [Gaiellaceae bacterium MAG52_C11]|nr:class I SAM-dependent methyltransferase [Candidatus Gaiellasilicea maunaloa]